jgi:hypothetical protein
MAEEKKDVQDEQKARQELLAEQQEKQALAAQAAYHKPRN